MRPESVKTIFGQYLTGVLFSSWYVLLKRLPRPWYNSRFERQPPRNI